MTPRDLAIVRWIGRLRFAEGRYVATRFAMDQRNVYRRLRGLVALQLVEHRRIFHAQPGAYSATRAGLGAAGLTLPPPRVDLRTYHHDRAQGVVMIALEREFCAHQVLTERELRSRDLGAPQRPRYGVWLGGQRTRRGLHFPDLAVELESGETLAIEVELTARAAADSRRSWRHTCAHGKWRRFATTPRRPPAAEWSVRSLVPARRGSSKFEPGRETHEHPSPRGSFAA